MVDGIGSAILTMPQRHPETESSERSPDAEEARAALALVLGSSIFEPASRATEFLRFVVEETLAGRGGRLKGYTIAVEVFDRPPDFDSQTDPVVRVEAGRLRRRLMEYYMGDGRNDPVRIELPRGGYMPRFKYSSAALAERAAESGLKGRLRQAALVWSAVAALAIAVTAVLTWMLSNPGPADVPVAATGAPDAAIATGSPRMIVLPLANLSGDSSFDAFAGGLTEEIMLALVRLDILATASPTGVAVESTALSELRTRFEAGYVFTGSVRTSPESVRMAFRLIDASAGTQLWTRTFDEPLDASGELALQERVARMLAMLLASPFGPVFVHETERVAGKPVEELDPYECLLRFYGYARTFDPGQHAQSVRCMQRAVASEPEFAPAWSALAVLYLHEHNFGYTPQPDRGDALARALEAVRTSLDIDGSDRVAAITMAAIQLASNDRAAFDRAAARALATEPAHPAVLAQIGFLFTLAGDWQRGLPLIDEAIPLTVNVPGWYYISYAFADLERDEYAQALDWALKVDAPTWFVTPLTVAATAALSGRPELAEREVARLLELYPDFAITGGEQLRKWRIEEALRSRLLEGLRLAGLDIS